MNDRDAGLNTMCYNYTFNNWRFITNDELNSWANAGKGNLHTYLNNSGWLYISLEDDKQLGAYVTYEFGYRSDIYGYDVVSGNRSTDCMLLDGRSSVYVHGVGFVNEADYNKFYWIICRSMDTNDMGKYFW